MTIRRITVAFVDSDGQTRGAATGSIDRRAWLIREARGKLEEFKTSARRDGESGADHEFKMAITDAPASVTWTPRP
jgi:hypothetical protein